MKILSNFYHKHEQYLPYFFWGLMLMVTYLMLIELPHKDGGWPYWDKVQHFFVFLGLSLMGAIAYIKHMKLVFIGLTLYGIAIELAQSAVTITRLGSVEDWLADITGVLFAWMLLYIKSGLQSKHAPSQKGHWQ